MMEANTHACKVQSTVFSNCSAVSTSTRLIWTNWREERDSRTPT